MTESITFEEKVNGMFEERLSILPNYDGLVQAFINKFIQELIDEVKLIGIRGGRPKHDYSYPQRCSYQDAIKDVLSLISKQNDGL